MFFQFSRGDDIFQRWSDGRWYFFTFGQFHHFRFHLFPRLERNDIFFGDIYLTTGSGVTSLSCGPLLNLENSEIPQFDATFPDQGFDDRIKCLLNYYFGLLLCQSDFLGNRSNNVFLGQNSLPDTRSQPCGNRHKLLRLIDLAVAESRSIQVSRQAPIASLPYCKVQKTSQRTIVIVGRTGKL